LKNHLNRRRDCQSIRDNYSPIELLWENVEQEAMMPIFRENYMEMQVAWSIYTTEIEMERFERNGRMYS